MGIRNKLCNWILRGAVTHIDYKVEYDKMCEYYDRLDKLYIEQNDNYKKLMAAYEAKQESLNHYVDNMCTACKGIVKEFNSSNTSADQRIHEIEDLYNKMVVDYNNLLDDTKKVIEKYNLLVISNNLAAALMFTNNQLNDDEEGDEEDESDFD